MRVKPGWKWTQFAGNKKNKLAKETLAGGARLHSCFSAGGRFPLSAFIVFAIALFNIALVGTATHATAQESGLLASGDAAVTGFSGTVETAGKTYIDPQGAAVKVLGMPQGVAARGQVFDAPVRTEIPAATTGQVFGIAIDNAIPPNIYVIATSAFGLHIVSPGAGGALEPAATGGEGAQFMEGQFGPGGGPGSIWKVDGRTGEVSLFANLPNSGAALGNIAYDPVHFQFFVSELDAGVIYQLDTNGNVIGTYDHGVNGRPGNGLPGVADDGSQLDITSSDFDSGNPNTWASTDIRRRVRGLALYKGRLYYSVDDGPQIWSVGFGADGTFSDDATLEVDAVAGGMPITDILFTPRGWMVLAQRGLQQSDADFAAFHLPGMARVLRYRRDPVSDAWNPLSDEYDVGLAGNRRASTGGVALACDGTLWITGDSLRNDAVVATDLGGGMLEVNGMQGLNVSLVRPDPTALGRSLFIDFDGIGGDADKVGHVGDVVIFRDCGGPPRDVSMDWPGWIPPGNWTPPPDWLPPPWWPVDLPDIDIFKEPAQCIDDPANPGAKLCTYTISVANFGGGVFAGILAANDNPEPGVAFVPPPGGSIAWACAQPAGPGNPVQCESVFPVVLPPGASEVLDLTMRIPAGAPAAAYANCAVTGVGGGPVVEDCSPPGSAAGLLPDKQNLGCHAVAGGVQCRVRISTTNTGGGIYVGPLNVNDEVGPGVSYVPPVANFPPFHNWSCAQAGAGAQISCDEALAFLMPGDTAGVEFEVFIPAGSPPASYSNCVNLDGGGPDMCVNIAQEPDLRLEKTLDGPCIGFINKVCSFTVVVTNIGTQDFAGALTVFDPAGGSLPPGTTLVGVNAPWNCGGLPAALPAVTCTRPPVLLVPGASTVLHLTMNVPFGGWWLQHNCARVDFVDATPGNNRDCAVLIDPSNLKLEKTLKNCTKNGEDRVCDFILKATNLGPDPYRAVLNVTDTLPPGTSYAGHSGEGWSCVANGGTVDCTNPSTETEPLGPGQSSSVVIKVTVPKSVSGSVENCALVKHSDSDAEDNRDCASIPPLRDDKPRACPSETVGYPAGAKLPAGWNVQLTLKNGIRCVKPGRDPDQTPPPVEAEPIPDPQCDIGERNVRSRAYARSRGWPVRRVVRGGVAIWCATPVARPRPPRCRAGEREVPSEVHADRRGWPVRRVVRGGVAIWCAIPVARPRPPRCRAGEREVPSAAHAERRGWKVRRVVRGDVAIWCAVPVSRPDCFGGQYWNGKACVCRRGLKWDGEVCFKPRPRCTGGQYWSGKACVCKRGLKWNGKNCVKPRPRCTGGQYWSGKACVCKRGLKWNGKNCVKPRPRCTGGQYWSGKACVCKRGLKWNGKNCVKPRPRCTGGQYWSGKACVCKRGLRWNGRNCVKPRPRCTGGQYWNGRACVCKPGLKWNGKVCLTPLQ